MAFLLPGGLAAQTFRDFVTPQPLPRGSTLVIGFLGGVEAWNDPHRGVRKLALELRGSQSHLIFAEAVENRHTKRAIKLITKALDGNRDGKLETDELAIARVVLFGQSLGGAAAIQTARALNRRGIPVLLTVQVDSFGIHDGIIPPNVSKAANFYQQGPLTLRGRSKIHAEDPRRTQIVGNFQRAYAFWVYTPQDRANASWLRLALGGGHVKMETDPELWAQVEHLILETIAAVR